MKGREEKNTLTAGVRAVSTPLVARESQNATDPLRKMWDALHHHGCQPRGETYKFRARCPVHQGANADTLEVYEGSDRRAVFGCYAHGCDKRAILEALGLSWADMFPVGHRSGHKAKPRQPAKVIIPPAVFMDSLVLAGFECKAMVPLDKCPYCDAPRCVLWVHFTAPQPLDPNISRSASVAPFWLEVECLDGCSFLDVHRAVETRAAITEGGLKL